MGTTSLSPLALFFTVAVMLAPILGSAWYAIREAKRMMDEPHDKLEDD